jgi:hypothetical protein
MREQYDAQLGLQMHLKAISSAREASERNRPTFRLPLVRKCPNFEGLACIKWGKFSVELFCFCPMLANIFYAVVFVCLRANVGANF